MRTWIALAILLSLSLAGCSGGGGGGGGGTDGTDDDGGKVDVTDDTGGIRGVVVDAAIVPIEGAFVQLNSGENTTSDADGRFSFSRLTPGDYVIQVGKPGYVSANAATTVVAGEDEPRTVRVLLERLTSVDPYYVPFRLDGFYECGFGAAGVITDSCDFGYRTGYDAAHPPAVPRTVLKFSNTQFIDIPADVITIVQEGFWTSDAVSEFIVMVDSTPIDNACDCSATYQNVKGPVGVLNRIEKYQPDGSLTTEFRDDLGFGGKVGEFPVDVTVAARGFLPAAYTPLVDPFGSGSSTDPQEWATYAVNFGFTVMTTVFHGYQPDAAWTFETREQFE